MAGDYYVLRSPIPSALVECGFLSNPEEEKLLLDAAYHERIAAALADEGWIFDKVRHGFRRRRAWVGEDDRPAPETMALLDRAGKLVGTRMNARRYRDGV